MTLSKIKKIFQLKLWIKFIKITHNSKGFLITWINQMYRKQRKPKNNYILINLTLFFNQLRFKTHQKQLHWILIEELLQRIYEIDLFHKAWKTPTPHHLVWKQLVRRSRLIKSPINFKLRTKMDRRNQKNWKIH